jgi:hypothetical protein
MNSKALRFSNFRFSVNCIDIDASHIMKPEYCEPGDRSPLAVNRAPDVLAGFAGPENIHAVFAADVPVVPTPERFLFRVSGPAFTALGMPLALVFD